MSNLVHGPHVLIFVRGVVCGCVSVSRSVWFHSFEGFPNRALKFRPSPPPPPPNLAAGGPKKKFGKKNLRRKKIETKRFSRVGPMGCKFVDLAVFSLFLE